MFIKELKYKKEKNGCWICTSHNRDKDGYAIFQRNKKWQRIHRYMYEKEKGKIPKGKLISHKCNNHPCINPAHLFISNIKEIRKKAVMEGRNAFGERQGSSKLKENQVIEIFKDRITKKVDLCKRYNIGRSTILRIQSGNGWRNITKDIDKNHYINLAKEHKKRKKREYNKRYRQEHKLKLRIYDTKYQKKRRGVDPEYKIRKILRHYLSQALVTYTKTGKIMSSKRYGIDYKAIIKHLKPFPKDLSNYQIHHIKPLFTFKFMNKNGSQNLKAIKEAFKPENHKWITSRKHREINHRKLLENLNKEGD